jgi:hypothetical protein
LTVGFYFRLEAVQPVFTLSREINDDNLRIRHDTLRPHRAAQFDPGARKTTAATAVPDGTRGSRSGRSSAAAVQKGALAIDFNERYERLTAPSCTGKYLCKRTLTTN